MILKIKKNETGIRLDSFLAGKLFEYSRQWIKKNILEGNILVNGKEVKPKYIFKKNDKISVNISLPKKINLEPDGSIKLDVVWENENVAVINKPAGLVVHPSDAHKSGTLVNAILARWPSLRNVGEDKFRPGIVHRLDKDTSGFLLIAKNNKVFKYLKEQFQKRKIEKRYLALAYGQIDEKQGIIKKSIERSKKIPTKQKTVDIENETDRSKKAETRYKVIKKFHHYTLVEAIPKTGRMHQIRVHFASLGHPLAGDKKYSFKRQKQMERLNRHFLHAAYLKFKLPDGEIIEIKSELPKDLNNFLKKIRN